MSTFLRHSTVGTKNPGIQIMERMSGGITATLCENTVQPVQYSVLNNMFMLKDPKVVT